MLNGPSTPLDNTGAIALSTQTASVHSLTATLTCSTVSNIGHHPALSIRRSIRDRTYQRPTPDLPAANPSHHARQHHRNRRAEPDNTRPAAQTNPVKASTNSTSVTASNWTRHGSPRPPATLTHPSGACPNPVRAGQ